MVRKNSKRVAIYFIGLITILAVFFVGEQPRKPFNADCEIMLVNLTDLEIKGIIVDVNFLDKIDRNGDFTFSYIKIAVNNESDNGHTTFNNYEVTVDIIVYFDDPAKEYLLFDDNGIQRAVPRMGFLNVSNVQVPEDPQRFINYWNRSKMIECLNIPMNRTDTSRYLPIPHSFQQMALLRNLLIEYGMFSILLGGTLLGWYRECSIVPHTTDMDFGVFPEHFNSQFEVDVLAGRTPFRMFRRLGMPNDSLEYTVISNRVAPHHFDIFFLYKDKDELWVGGTGGELQKYRYYYPSFNSTCSADLGGFLFWVPCEPEKILETDYGEWRQDHPTSKYYWNKSGRNIRNAGNWSKEIKNDVYVLY